MSFIAGGGGRSNMKKLYIWIVFLLMIDLGTKWWAERSIPIGNGIKLSNQVSFVLVHNKGISFGILSSHPYFALILQIVGVLSIAFFVTTFSSKYKVLQSVIKILILSGAIGNFLNRLVFGYVIDFISIKPYPFVFNIADIELRLGLFLIICFIITRSVNNFKTGNNKIHTDYF